MHNEWTISACILLLSQCGSDGIPDILGSPPKSVVGIINKANMGNEYRAHPLMRHVVLQIINDNAICSDELDHGF
jgi:hypothetical protein